MNIYLKLKKKFCYILHNYSFYINNYLSDLFYKRMVNKYHKFYTTVDDVKELTKIITHSKVLSFLDKDQHNFKFSERKIFQNNQLDREVYKNMSLYTTWFNLEKSSFLDEYLKKILPLIKEKLHFPFAIVNLRAWKSKQNAKPTIHNGRERGAFRMHKDKMPPGHLKCMIYLNPLDVQHGKFQIDDEIFEDDMPGLSIIFRNSDFNHQAITGNQHFRLVIEITIMKTFIKVDELKYYPSSPNSLYLKNAFFVYL